MLSPDDIAAAAADLESFHVERKSSFKSVKSSIEEAICAFSNDLSGSGRTGVVLIGVDDAGAPSGLEVTDQLLREVSDIRSAGAILPLPRMTVYKADLSGVALVA